MVDLNRTMIIGNLAQDPEVRDMGNGKEVTNFAIAVNRTWEGPQGEEGKEVSFIDCCAFGKTGETIEKYLTKGRRILIEGRLKQDRWINKDTSKPQNKIRVIVEKFHFMDSKKADDAPEAIPASAGNEEGSTMTDEDFDAI